MKSDPAVTGECMKRLGLLKEEFPYLKDVAEIYEAIMPLVLDSDLHVGPVSITSREALSKLERGVHLLSDLDMELDGDAVSGLMLRLCHAVECSAKNSMSPLVKAAKDIGTAIEE